MKLKTLIHQFILVASSSLFAQSPESRVRVFDYDEPTLRSQIEPELTRFRIVVKPSDEDLTLDFEWRLYITPTVQDVQKFSWRYNGKPASEFNNAIYPATWTTNDWSRSSPHYPRFVSKSGLVGLAADVVKKAFDAHFHDDLEEEKFLKSIEYEIRQLYTCLARAHEDNPVKSVVSYKKFDESLHDYFRKYLRNENLSDEDRDKATRALVGKLMPFIRNEFETNFTVSNRDIITSWRIQILEYQLALLRKSYPRFGFPDKTITEYVDTKMRVDPSLQGSLNCFKSITKSIYNNLSNPDNKDIYTDFVKEHNSSELDKWKKLLSVGDSYLSVPESGLRPLTPSGEDNEGIYRLATLDYLVNILKTAKNRMNTSSTP